MTYNPTGEYLALSRRILTGLLDFKGRSTRTEIWVFFFVVTAMNSAAMVLTELFFGGLPLPYSQYSSLAVFVLATSLFARRLHDQNRSGWLAVILPVFLVLKLYGQILFDTHQRPVAALGFPFILAELVLVIAFWVLVVWPGTDGENRFGQDPRRVAVADSG